MIVYLSIGAIATSLVITVTARTALPPERRSPKLFAGAGALAVTGSAILVIIALGLGSALR